MNFKITTNRDRLIKQLQDYKQKLEQYMDAVVKGICGVVRDKAQVVYGGSGVVVSVNPIEQGSTAIYEVMAEGEAVCFIEFGAGDTTDETAEYALNLASSAGVYVYAGSWSKNYGNASMNPPVHPNYYQDKYWMLGSQKMTYVEPKRALYNAVHDSSAEFEQVINVNRSILG